MDIAQKIIEVGQRLGSAKDFYEFSKKLHTTLGCSKVSCDIKSYIDSLKDVTDLNKDYDYCKNIFIIQSVNYQKVFNSLHRLKIGVE